MANILGINLHGLDQFCSAGKFSGKDKSGKYISYTINRNKLERLVAYIEKQKKVADTHHQQRYAIMWYDFLCSCSTPSGRAHLDIATLMVQLEGMFYYLLNGVYNKPSKSYSSYKKVYNSISFIPINVVFKEPPLDVKLESNLHYIIIALRVLDRFEYLIKDGKITNTSKPSKSRDFIPLQSPYGPKDLLDIIENFIDSKHTYWNWNNIKDKDKNSKGGTLKQFATLINIIWDFIIKKNPNLQYLNIDVIKNNLNNLRNNASHGGSNSAAQKAQYDDIIRFILLIATELNEYTKGRENRNGRHILETITTTLTSGELLKTINKTINKICEIIDNMGKKKWLLAVMIITMGILGYFIYKDSSTTINYSNVPAVKRIELYDKAMSNELSEEYVKRMQSDIQRFEAIKQEVEQ